MSEVFREASPADQAARAYEKALIDIESATDSRGLRIRLLPYSPVAGLPKARDFRAAIGRLCANVSADSVFLQSIERADGLIAEANFVTNLELLVRGWRACLVYEGTR